MPVPGINRPSARAVNPTRFMNTDASPKKGRSVGVASPFMSAIYSILVAECCALFFCFIYLFCGIIEFSLFFSQRDFMVHYFDFMNSYSENGMLFF